MDFNEWWSGFKSRMLACGWEPTPETVAEAAWNEAYRQGRLDAEAHFREQLASGGTNPAGDNWALRKGE